MASCKEFIEIRQEKLQEEISTFNRAPKLCVIQVGADPASEVYVKNKQRLCEKLGIDCEHVHITEYEHLNDTDLIRIVFEKNSECIIENTLDGIIVQLPLPKQFNSKLITSFVTSVADVDGFGKDSPFTPCTPKGIMDYLKYNGVEFSGKECVVIGRSDIVGKPLVNLLIEEGATVTCCNSKTKNIRKHTLGADIVISAIGKPNYFDESYFTSGQILVDVGINRGEDGKLCGDICKKPKEFVSLATPVPGGVGILTTNALMENVVAAYKGRNK